MLTFQVMNANVRATQNSVINLLEKVCQGDSSSSCLNELQRCKLQTNLDDKCQDLYDITSECLDDYTQTRSDELIQDFVTECVQP